LTHSFPLSHTDMQLRCRHIDSECDYVHGVHLPDLGECVLVCDCQSMLSFYLQLFLFLSSSSFFFLYVFLSLSIYLSFPTQLRHALVCSSCYTRPVPPIKALSIYRDMMCAFTTLIKVCVFECVCVCMCVCVYACVRVRVCRRKYENRRAQRTLDDFLFTIEISPSASLLSY
jgi:hypothetical protein